MIEKEIIVGEHKYIIIFSLIDAYERLSKDVALKVEYNFADFNCLEYHDSDHIKHFPLSDFIPLEAAEIIMQEYEIAKNRLLKMKAFLL